MLTKFTLPTLDLTLTVHCQWPMKGPIRNADINIEPFPLPAPPPTSTMLPQVICLAAASMCHVSVLAFKTLLNFVASSGFKC